MKKTLSAIIILSLGFCLAGRPGYALNPGKELGTWAQNLEIQARSGYKNLAIFPLCRELKSKLPDISSLDEALARGDVSITEVNGGEVNQICLVNHSFGYVFIMAGEILSGCKQDRILQNDLLLPPHSGKIIAEAYCVEQGRWSAKSDKFDSSRNLSNIQVRQQARISNSQGKVWEAVRDSYHMAKAAPSATGALQEIYRDETFKSRWQDYYAKLHSLRGDYPGMCGAIVAVNGEILCLDCYGSPRLFGKYWDKLLQSYCLEAAAREGESRLAPPGIKQARSYLNNLANADYALRDTPGAGTLAALASLSAQGSVLWYKSQPVHLELFPEISYSRDEGGAKDPFTPLQRQYR